MGEHEDRYLMFVVDVSLFSVAEVIRGLPITTAPVVSIISARASVCRKLSRSG
jgi:hypothetical protein